jgi:predicted ArsR family transcriptional regulator
LEQWPLQERVSFVTEVMHAEGGFAEWEATPDGLEVRDYNCLFRRLLKEENSAAACEWHMAFLTKALGAHVEPSACEGQQCCSFLIHEPAATRSVLR